MQSVRYLFGVGQKLRGTNVIGFYGLWISMGSVFISPNY